MIFKHTEVFNFEGAFRGMRNPLNSHNKSDSYYDNNNKYIIGQNDLNLAQKLIKGGSEHRKFMRQIFVSVDITAPAYLMAEFDTYKVGVTRNSSSFMHKGVSKRFEITDFECGNDKIVEILSGDSNLAYQYYEWKNGIIRTYDKLFDECYAWDILLETLNRLRDEYLSTKDDEIFIKIRKLLPMSYLYTSTVSLNYENLRNMYLQRKTHRLSEWSKDFVDWIKTLPYAEELIMYK